MIKKAIVTLIIVTSIFFISTAVPVKAADPAYIYPIPAPGPIAATYNPYIYNPYYYSPYYVNPVYIKEFYVDPYYYAPILTSTYPQYYAPYYYYPMYYPLY
ncbi:MAG: hypothetical protein K6E49_00945 [Lachnospiraceae bacterium]|nr:hypothetical protein [Lachnospiraceae bacterium]